MPEKLALTSNGRFVAFCQDDDIHILDTMGPAPRRVLPMRAEASPASVMTYSLSDGKTISRMTLGSDAVAGRSRRGGRHAIVPVAHETVVAETSEDGMMVVERGVVSPSGLDAARVLCASGRRVIVATDRGAEIRTSEGAPRRHYRCAITSRWRPRG